MTPEATLFTPGQPPSTETISTPFSLPAFLSAWIGAFGGRLVDRVDQVHVRVLGEQRLRRLEAAVGRSERAFVADDAAVLLGAEHLPVRHVDAEAREEAGVAQHVDRNVVLVDVEHGDVGVLGLVAELRLRPLADQYAGLEIVGREGRVLRVLVAERRVERDDEDAGGARLLERRADASRSTG